MKRFLLVMAVLLCGLLLIAGGAAQRSGRTTASGADILTITVPANIRISDYKDNIQTRLIEQATNTSLEFTILPSGPDFVNRLNLMVMAGGDELTDLIAASPGDAMVFQWANEGAIIPITDYYRNPAMSPHLQESIRRTGVNFIPQITSPDGEIYGFPALNLNRGNELDFKFFYYKPWLDRLGMEFPRYTHEFPALLRAVANTDLNGNGRRDEIPLVGTFRINGLDYGRWFNWLMNSFVYAGHPNLLTVYNGRVDVAYNTNEWRQGLQFIRSLFEEGLIPMETFTNDETSMRTLINQDGPTVFSFAWFTTEQMNAGNPYADHYEMPFPMIGPGGRQYIRFQPSVANIGMMISKNAVNINAALRVGDYMTTETQGHKQRYGAEGIDWIYAKDIPNIQNYMSRTPGIPISVLLFDDPGFWGGSAVHNHSWRQVGPFVRAYEGADGLAIPNDGSIPQRTLNVYRFTAMYNEQGVKPEEVIPKLIYTADEIGEVTELLTNLSNYVTTMTAAFLAGSQNINSDAAWNAYISELNNIGVRRMLTIVQRVYDRMYR